MYLQFIGYEMASSLYKGFNIVLQYPTFGFGHNFPTRGQQQLWESNPLWFRSALQYVSKMDTIRLK